MEKIDNMFIAIVLILAVLLIITRIRENREEQQSDSKETTQKVSSVPTNCCEKVCKRDLNCMDNCLQSQNIADDKNMPFEVNGVMNNGACINMNGPSCPKCNNSPYYSYDCNNCGKCKYSSISKY